MAGTSVGGQVQTVKGFSSLLTYTQHQQILAKLTSMMCASKGRPLILKLELRALMRQRLKIGGTIFANPMNGKHSAKIVPQQVLMRSKQGVRQNMPTGG